MDVRGKRVLVFGLGLLGGGLATAKWLLREGAVVRVTDRKGEAELSPTLEKLGRHRNLSYTLGGHKEEDVRWADLVVVNPGVPREHPHLSLAQALKKPLVNDTALFFSRIKRPVIAVTGTRGKTTVTSWIAALLSVPGRKIRPSGNTPQNPLLREIGRKATPSVPAVAELSSWQLELLPEAPRGPKIAVITNLYPDHLNRYQGMEEYADAKANIFFRQTREDTLVLNAENEWTPYFLKKRPGSRVLFTSRSFLAEGKDGYFVDEDAIVARVAGKNRRVVSVAEFRKRFGEHNLMNLLQAVAAARSLSPHARISERRILALKTPPFRQEIVLKRKGLTVVNDSAGTSPDGTIAAIERFRALGEMILITGGTDKNLEESALARAIAAHVPPERLVLLDGSATAKLAEALQALGYPRRGLAREETLSGCVKRAFAAAAKAGEKAVIVFSPGAASFEKFKNEFDRGERFTALVRGFRKPGGRV